MLAVRQSIRRFRCCAWCGRFKHTDGSTHGQPLPRPEAERRARELARRGGSTGICAECLARELARA